MALKSINELRINHNEQTANAILKMVFDAPQAGDLCRWTISDLEKWKSHLDGLLYRHGDQKYLEALNQLTRLERNLIQRMASIGPNWEASEKGKAKRAAIERDCRTANEKLTRYIKDAEELFLAEADLKRQFDEITEMKKRFAHRTDNSRAELQKRFA